MRLHPPSVAVWLLALLLGACSSTPPVPPVAPGGDGWAAVPLPGKRATRYSADRKDGRPAILAQADRSASLWRRRWPIPAEHIGQAQFSWWVAAPLAGADLAQAGLDDAAARVLFAFDGDHARLSARNRLMYELAESLAGERPPFATLMYVYGNRPEKLGRVIVHPRSDRVRAIVLDAGAAHAGRWREHRRDLAADYRLAFGEEPGPLLSVAMLTDSDGTQQQAQAWYGTVALTPHAP